MVTNALPSSKYPAQLKILNLHKLLKRTIKPVLYFLPNLVKYMSEFSRINFAQVYLFFQENTVATFAKVLRHYLTSLMLPVT